MKDKNFTIKLTEKELRDLISNRISLMKSVIKRIKKEAEYYLHIEDMPKNPYI